MIPMVMLMGRVGGTAILIRSSPLLINVPKSIVPHSLIVSSKYDVMDTKKMNIRNLVDYL